MMTAHKIRLNPTPAQATALSRQLGYARVAYNSALSDFKSMLDRGEFPERGTLRVRWNAAKDKIAPWHNDKTETGKKIHSELAAKNAIIDLRRGIDAWAKAVVERKRGAKTRRVGFPRFRKRGGGGDGWRVSNGRGTVRTNGRGIKLPLVGWVKMTERLRFSRPVIMEATVSRRAGKYFVSFSCEVADLPKPDLSRRPAVAIDAGERTLATVRNRATGEITRIENPRSLERALAKLRRAQKAVSRKKPGSKRRERAKLRVAKIHYRVTCIREDNIQKATSAIAKLAGRIVVEDLGVAGMARKRRGRNARGLYDASMAEFLRVLKYKAERLGIEFVEVEPAFTSKTCSACGAVNAALGSEERWTCPACGVKHQRDENAATVIDERDTGSSPERPQAVDGGWLERGGGVRRPIAAAAAMETLNSEQDREC